MRVCLKNGTGTDSAPVAKMGGDTDLAPHRHLQVPDQIDGDAQERDVGNQTASRLFGCPDLGAWRAGKDRDEEEGGIGYRVHVDQALSKPVADVTLDGAEDSQDEEQDGAFGEEER
ncbi:hypothetical protein HO133_009495 [Letharia lupina]|uniref:Uncharacterized protein n=1 Tax=Letharia lupina TaxID=560253 RepID=A0A8H6CKV5_9LECA|nr:uncharacterized protein HO133_009495 [Letharia lupina]KAF6225495.1 hypothetical protein HO133_009495 [Letharia lupina]